MSRGLNVPYFAAPPPEYSQQYFSQLTRAFALYAQQVNSPGPWRATELTLTELSGNVTQGQLSWNAAEETVDLTMGSGVTQQIGFETYLRATNDTGVTIPNGTVVGFAGVDGEIKVSPFLADGSIPEVYFVGLTTFDMVDGATGPITIYGKIRDIDTTGPGAETWVAGDILYASPTVAGQLTKVRPTAPDAVVVVAAVLKVGTTDGEILVRPTIPMGLDYGTFDATTDRTLAAINTATAVTFDNTLTSNGVSRGTPTSRLVVSAAGFYQFDANLQISSGSASAKNVYFWLRKNGTDVADTTRALTVALNEGFTPVALTYTISLLAADYVELMWAGDSTAVTLEAIPTLAFAPSAPSALVSLTQIQL